MTNDVILLFVVVSVIALHKDLSNLIASNFSSNCESYKVYFFKQIL